MDNLDKYRFTFLKFMTIKEVKIVLEILPHQCAPMEIKVASDSSTEICSTNLIRQLSCFVQDPLADSHYL